MTPSSPRAMRLAAAGFGALMLGRAVGMALTPALLTYEPLWLIVLGPFLANFILVAPLVEPWHYALVATGFAWAQCVVGYTFGHVCGPRARDWLLKHRLVSGRTLARVTRWLDRAAPLVISLLPGPVMSALAGIGGARPRSYYPAMIVSQVGWIIACFYFGALIASAIERLRAMVAQHALALTVLSALLVAVALVWRRRSARA